VQEDSFDGIGRVRSAVLSRHSWLNNRGRAVSRVSLCHFVYHSSDLRYLRAYSDLDRLPLVEGYRQRLQRSPQEPE